MNEEEFIVGVVGCAQGNPRIVSIGGSMSEAVNQALTTTQEQAVYFPISKEKAQQNRNCLAWDLYKAWKAEQAA